MYLKEDPWSDLLS